MKRFPVTLFQSHYSIYIVGRSDFLSNSTGPVSPSEQPDRPGFRANFSRWGPGGLDLNLPPIRAVLKLPTTRPIRVSSGFDYLRTDQMFGPMPLLFSIQYSFLPFYAIWYATSYRPPIFLRVHQQSSTLQSFPPFFASPLPVLFSFFGDSIKIIKANLARLYRLILDTHCRCPSPSPHSTSTPHSLRFSTLLAFVSLASYPQTSGMRTFLCVDIFIEICTVVR